jgi:hypothetical protein
MSFGLLTSHSPVIKVNRKPGVEDGRQDKGLAPMNYQLLNTADDLWRQKIGSWRPPVCKGRISQHKGGA